MRWSNFYTIGAQKNYIFTNATQRNTRARHEFRRRGKAARESATSPVARKVDIFAEHKELRFTALYIWWAPTGRCGVIYIYIYIYIYMADVHYKKITALVVIYPYINRRLWCPLYITTPSKFWPWVRSVRKRISYLFFWDKNVRPRTLHKYDTIHCIKAIIFIIIVVHSPPREAHYPHLPPFACILLTYFSLHYTLLTFLLVVYLHSYFKFFSPFPCRSG